MQTATELDIPIIDIRNEVFDPHPDPLSLFPFRMYGHYNAEGYKLVAESISKRLKADGIIPLNSKYPFWRFLFELPPKFEFKKMSKEILIQSMTMQ